MHEFEFDPDKSMKNMEKHGIDFVEGQELWQDVDLLQIKAKTIDEDRYIVIGKIDNKYWTGVITYRENKVRIISIRASRYEEKELYEGKGI
jgi:uncharacterized protein